MARQLRGMSNFNMVRGAAPLPASLPSLISAHPIAAIPTITATDIRLPAAPPSFRTTPPRNRPLPPTPRGISFT